MRLPISPLPLVFNYLDRTSLNSYVKLIQRVLERSEAAKLLISGRGRPVAACTGRRYKVQIGSKRKRWAIAQRMASGVQASDPTESGFGIACRGGAGLRDKPSGLLPDRIQLRFCETVPHVAVGQQIGGLSRVIFELLAQLAHESP